jgi:hypothetical protein
VEKRGERREGQDENGKEKNKKNKNKKLKILTPVIKCVSRTFLRSEDENTLMLKNFFLISSGSSPKKKISLCAPVSASSI